MPTPEAPAEAPYRSRIVGHGEEAPDQLLANPGNFRVHPKFQQDAMNGVLSEVGWVQSVIVNRTTGHVIDGHLRVALAISADQPSVPVVYVELDPLEEAKILATFDPISALAGTDREQLSTLLGDVSAEDATLKSFLAGLKPVQRALAPDGEANGETPEALRDTFESATIRQIVLHYPVAEHARMTHLLGLLRDDYAEDANPAALLALLEEHYGDDPRAEGHHAR